MPRRVGNALFVFQRDAQVHRPRSGQVEAFRPGDHLGKTIFSQNMQHAAGSACQIPGNADHIHRHVVVLFGVNIVTKNGKLREQRFAVRHGRRRRGQRIQRLGRRKSAGDSHLRLQFIVDQLQLTGRIFCYRVFDRVAAADQRGDSIEYVRAGKQHAAFKRLDRRGQRPRPALPAALGLTELNVSDGRFAPFASVHNKSSQLKTNIVTTNLLSLTLFLIRPDPAVGFFYFSRPRFWAINVGSQKTPKSLISQNLRYSNWRRLRRPPKRALYPGTGKTITEIAMPSFNSQATAPARAAIRSPRSAGPMPKSSVWITRPR